MSITIVAGSKQKLLKAVHEITRHRRSVVITYNEHNLCISDNCRVIIIENLFDLLLVLTHINDVDVVIADIYNIIKNIKSRYGHQLAKRLTEKAFVWLYAYSKARGIDVYILSPLCLINNEPLINTPNYLVVSKVKLL